MAFQNREKHRIKRERRRSISVFGLVIYIIYIIYKHIILYTYIYIIRFIGIRKSKHELDMDFTRNIDNGISQEQHDENHDLTVRKNTGKSKYHVLIMFLLV